MPDLPDDIEHLKRLLTQSQVALAAAEVALHDRDLEIEALKLQLAKLKRMQFGRSSEQLDGEIAQLQLALDSLESDKPDVHAVTEPVDPSPRRKPVRRALPDHLPRDERRHQPDPECPDCGGTLRYLGQDVSEVLEYVPGRFKVIRDVRPKLSCGACQQIVQCAAPSRPIERGLAGPELLAHVLVSKYADHLPLYRQCEIYARDGVDLQRSTLAGWVASSSALLAPLVAAIGRHVTDGDKLHADDTPVPVLDPGRGKTKTGRLWAYVRDDRPACSEDPPAVWFCYSPDRKGKHPRAHLAKFSGTLQADAYAGFNGLYDRDNNPLVEAACWAHARRKFYDIYVAQGSPLAHQAVERIGALYKIEAQIRGQPPDKRQAIRQARAGPLLADLYDWLLASYSTLSKKSGLAGETFLVLCASTMT